MKTYSPDLRFIPAMSVLMIFLFMHSGAMAHGVQIKTTIQPPAVTVNAFFSRTSPVGNGVVSVYAPGNDQPWQTGRTDASGNFAFLPDQAGEWTVHVDDERGHIGRTRIQIAEGFFSGSGAVGGSSDGSPVTERFEVHDDGESPEVHGEMTTSMPAGDATDAHDGHSHEHDISTDEGFTCQIPMIFRIIFGLVLIFGITGIFYGLKARQALRKSGNRH